MKINKLKVRTDFQEYALLLRDMCRAEANNDIFELSKMKRIKELEAQYPEWCED